MEGFTLRTAAHGLGLFVVGLSLLQSATLSVAQAALGAGQLQDEVRDLIQSSKLGAARVGVCLMDPRDGTLLASYNAYEPFTPASNMKLLTSGAAVMVLGPDFVFKTEVALDGTKLIIKGSGDPALGDPEVLKRGDKNLTVDDMLRTVAGALPKAGITSVSEVIVDDRVFDREFVHPRWNKENLHLAYSAPVAGINFHTNVLSVFPKPHPSGPGATPLYSTQPDVSWLRIDTSKARTISKGSNTVWLARNGDDTSFIMRGDVAVQAKVAADVTLGEPPIFFGRVMATNLISAGVKIADQTVVGSNIPTNVRVVQSDEAINDGRVLAVISTPIDEVLRRCNVDSENLYAESLFKRMGHAITKEPGSWTNGAAVLRMMLSKELGPEAAASTTVSDGSGLSPDNKVSPHTVAAWLSDISKKSWGPTFIHSLATPGEGTLEKRFRTTKLRNQVYAKSGYIKGVRCLSGFVNDPASGESLVFSILINDLPSGGSEIEHMESKKLHEEIVELLDKTLAKRVGAREAKVGG